MFSCPFDELAAAAVRVVKLIPMLLGVQRLGCIPGRPRVARLLLLLGFEISAMRRVVITCSCIHDEKGFRNRRASSGRILKCLAAGD